MTLLSSLAYPMITHTPLVAGNLPIKTLVARQWPTNNIVHACWTYCVWKLNILCMKARHIVHASCECSFNTHSFDINYWNPLHLNYRSLSLTHDTHTTSKVPLCRYIASSVPLSDYGTVVTTCGYSHVVAPCSKLVITRASLALVPHAR